MRPAPPTKTTAPLASRTTPVSTPWPEVRRADGLRFVLLLLYIVSLSYGIPLRAIPGLSWAVWPTLSDLVWAVAFPVVVVSVLEGTTKSSPVGRRFVLLMVYAVFISLLAHLRYENASSSLQYTAYWFYRLIQWATMYRLAVSISYPPRRLRYVAWAVAVSGAIVAVACILQKCGGYEYRSLVQHLPADTSSGPWRARVLFTGEGALGTLNYNRIGTGIFIGICFLLLLGSRLVGVFWAFPLGGVLLFGMMLTGSRSATVFIAVGLFYLLACSQRLTVRFRAAAIATAGFLFVLAYFGQMAIVKRCWDPSGGAARKSFSERYEHWLEGLKSVEEDPLALLIGTGPGCGSLPVGGRGILPSHGQYVNTLVELGILGIILWARVLLTVYREIKRRGALANVAKALTWAVLIAAIFNDLVLPALAAVPPLVITLIGVAASRQQQERAVPA